MKFPKMRDRFDKEEALLMFIVSVTLLGGLLFAIVAAAFI